MQSSPRDGAARGSGTSRPPPAASDETEHRARLAIEVVVLWHGDVLAVRHLSPPGTFYVGGARSACDVALPAELLGSERLCIAVGSHSEVSAVLPPGAEGWLALPDGSTRSLANLAQPSAEQLLPLGLGHRAHLCFAGLEVQVATVAASRAPAGRGSLGFEGRTLAYFGLSSLSVAGLFAALALLAPPLGLTQDERAAQERLYRLQSYLTASAERVLRQQDQQLPEAPARAAAAAHRQSRYQPDSAGREAAEESTPPVPLAEPEAVETTSGTLAQRKEAVARARNFGMIGLLGENLRMLSDPRLRYQRELSGSELAAMDQMFHPGPTWEEGPAGLALSGTGRRGGGQADVLPLGQMGTISEGQGTLPAGFARSGSSGGSRRAAPPQLHAAQRPGVTPAGNPAVIPPGALADGAAIASPASVRRAINGHYPRIRVCYDDGLRAQSAFAGKAVVSFVLQPDGRVAQLRTQGSALPEQVVRCIEGVFHELSLPRPAQPLRVDYPLQLAP